MQEKKYIKNVIKAVIRIILLTIYKFMHNSHLFFCEYIFKLPLNY